MQTLIEEPEASQGAVLRKPRHRSLAQHLSPSDRRLLLAASFRLLLKRLNHGIEIRRSDVLRLVDFADFDVEEVA
jgi:hypothetical protein